MRGVVNKHGIEVKIVGLGVYLVLAVTNLEE
jgi:hypothetical protein